MGWLTRCLDLKVLVIQVTIFASFYEFLIRRFNGLNQRAEDGAKADV